MNERGSILAASVGLAVGGAFGMAGTFAPTDSLRGLAWGIDGIALVMAASVLAIWFFRKNQDVVASGFLVFAIGEAIVLSTAPMPLDASVASFGTGAGLWSLALVLISCRPFFPLLVRLLGMVAGILFAVTYIQVVMGAHITPLTKPLPFFAYPVLVATMFGWIWTLLKANPASTATQAA